LSEYATSPNLLRTLKAIFFYFVLEFESNSFNNAGKIIFSMAHYVLER